MQVPLQSSPFYSSERFRTRRVLMKLVCLSFYLMPLPLTADCLPKTTHDTEGNFIVPGVIADIVYHQVGDSQLLLDAYIQKTGDNRPAVIVVHGGGWTSGSRISRVGQLLEVLTRGGFNWFSIDYRLAPRHKYPLALDDLRVAVEFVRCRADEFRIDKDRIALVGEDAGAHLAAMLASEKPPGVQALVALGGIYDLRSLDRFKGNGFATLFGDDRLDEREAVLIGASPIVKVLIKIGAKRVANVRTIPVVLLCLQREWRRNLCLVASWRSYENSPATAI